MKLMHASHLTNAELTTELSRLAGGEREATAALIVHLAEFDARRLYEPAGYPSMFKYCMAVLRLSEDAVYNRIEAARAARRYPAIVAMLESGALSPTTVRMLASRLTRENHADVLAAASGKGKQAVEELLAHRFPQAEVAARVRKVPCRPMAVASQVADVAVSIEPAATAATAVTAVTGGAAGAGRPAAGPAGTGLDDGAPILTCVPAAARHVVRPLAPDRYEIRFTASAAMRDKLRRVRDLLGHAVPSGDIAEVFDRALTLLEADLERKKFAATPRPQRSRGHSEDSPHIPAEVKRRVWARDQGRCVFVAAHGHRCGEERRIEYHHVVPRAAGGHATVENIQLRCRAHNGYEVDQFFGPGKRRTGMDLVGETPVIYGRAVARGRSGTSGSGVTRNGIAT